MKKFISFLIVLCSILVYTSAFAGVTKIKWTHSGDNTDSYVVYIQEEGTTTIRNIPIPKTVTVYLLSDLGLKIKTNYVLWITAKNNNGESDPSNKIQYYTSVPDAPVLEVVEE